MPPLAQQSTTSFSLQAIRRAYPLRNSVYCSTHELELWILTPNSSNIVGAHRETSRPSMNSSHSRDNDEEVHNNSYIQDFSGYVNYKGKPIRFCGKLWTKRGGNDSDSNSISDSGCKLEQNSHLYSPSPTKTLENTNLSKQVIPFKINIILSSNRPLEFIYIFWKSNKFEI